jgi:hypothetical protein
VRALKYYESSTAILKHLRHERQSFELPFSVERLQNLFFTPDLNPLTRAVWHFVYHFAKIGPDNACIALAEDSSV